MKTLSLSLLLSSSLFLACTASTDGSGFDVDTDEDAGLVGTVGSLSRQKSFVSGVKNGWARVERWADPNPNLVKEDYLPDGRANQDGQRLSFFGELQPASNKFLVYYAPGWDTNPIETPILLVHGANDSADRAWANPGELGPFGCGAAVCPQSGLMQYLSQRGYKVFAIGFPHKQGDNFYQAELIHDAIEVVKARTGAREVDLMGWSKGAFPARMYVAGLRQPWGTPYQGDVRKLMLIGGPNGGMDYLFRHGYSAVTECGNMNAPSPHTGILCYGFWRDQPELSLEPTAEGDFFPGQRQMLARFDDRYPVAASSFDQDWFTTYYGGLGFVSEGNGIQSAIDKGSLVKALQDTPVPAEVQTYLLCGYLNDIVFIHAEHTGPSDGMLFLDSCTDPTGIENNTDTGLLPMNHMKLGWDGVAVEQLQSWLEQ
jgi:hypothetical protein